MQPLASTHEDRLFRYTQLARTGNVALFTQMHKPSGHVRYEVVVITVAKEHTWPDGTTSPEREVYPSSSQWGRLAWTHLSEQQARAHLEALVVQAETNMELVEE